MTSVLRSSSRLTLTSGMEPPVKPTTTTRPSSASDAQRVGEAVAADRVEHQVDPAARELLRLLAPVGVGADDLVGARVARDLLLLVRGDDGDHLRGAEALGDLDGGGADPAGRAVHEHLVALGDPPADAQREVGRVVVEDQARALGDVELVGEREGHVRGRDGLLGEAAQVAAGGHAVPDGDSRVARHLEHRARDLRARDERQLGLELVLAAALQHLGEGDARRLDLDPTTPSPGVSMWFVAGSGTSLSSRAPGPSRDVIWIARIA